MSLNFRQTQAYRHLCIIYRPTTPITSGKPGSITYPIVASNVPCLFQPTPNINDPIPGGGTIKRPTIFTTDTLHMEAGIDCRAEDIVKNTTLLPNGQRSSNYGKFSRALGAPEVIENAGRRKANKQSMPIMEMEHPPAGLT